MRRVLCGLIVAVLLAGPASAAETQPLAWATHRAVADYISTGLVAGQLAADAVQSWRAPDRRRALAAFGCRVGVTVAASEGVKRLVHRTRPDGSDRLSFWSEHTALATTAAGWKVSVSVPIVLGVGELRQAAAKHYLTDVLAGAGAGWLARTACRGAE